MANLNDKLVLGIQFFIQIIVPFLVEKKYKYLSLTGSWFYEIGRTKTVKNVIHGNLRSLITSSCLVHC